MRPLWWMEKDFASKAETIVCVTEMKPFAVAEVVPDIAWKINNEKDGIYNESFKRTNYEC